MIDNAEYRFGSAGFATQADIQKAGLFTQHQNSFFTGFNGNKPLFYSGMGGGIIVAGARSGKLSTNLGYNLCTGYCQSDTVVLDPKGELAAVSQDQRADYKHSYYWNPAGLHGLPQHRVNPVDYLTIESCTLVSDMKEFFQNRIPDSGSANGAYFESRAREFGEAIALAVTEIEGTLTLPDLFYTVSLIAGDGDAWKNFADFMAHSRFPNVRSIQEEILASRDGSGNGFQGIIGELLKSFASLSDPVLMDSISPPYDFSFAQLGNPNQKCNVYLMPPAEFLKGWSPEIKSLFVSAMIHKSRKPQAAQQTWIIDECGQLGRFPLVTKMFTFGAGTGIRPIAVFQSTKQMNGLSEEAENIITSSAALRIYFGVRDYETASSLSRMIGSETLEFKDEQAQLQRQNAKREAVKSFFAGQDPFQAGLKYIHQKEAYETPHKQQRSLRNPDEILNMPAGKQFVFVDGLSKPLYADRKPYYEQPFMAGKYHPNPYHPPMDQVQVKTRFGTAWKRVLKQPVPAQFADYPQYQDGTYNFIEG